MPNAQLAGRFLADWPAPFSPQGELVYEGPRRQRELIALGRQQIDVQKAAASAVVRSNIAAAHIIASEISQQTVALDASLRDYSSRISSSVMDAADQISVAVEVLGDRLCAYLGEIRWQLAQQSETLTGILYTLRESRSNEARQLVEQGVRHYANEQYDRAEERFRQALQQDTTDYQVLMNIGLVAIHKGLTDEAFEFFEDALRLPAGLDKLSKNRALLAIARLHYAAGQYDKALTAARKAATLADPSQVSEVFLLGTYAALAGQVDESLERLEEAIRLRPDFFGKAAVEPNLDANRPAVMTLLSRLATEALAKVKAELGNAQRVLSKAGEHDESSMCANERELAQKTIDALLDRAQRASYTELLSVQQQAESVGQAVRRIVEAADAAASSRSVKQTLPDLTAKENEAKRDLEMYGTPVPPFRLRFWALWHFLTFIFIIGPLMVDQRNNRVPLIMPIYFFAGFAIWPWVQHLTWKRAEATKKRQDAEHSERTRAVSAATSATSQARARIDSFEKRSADLLAQARKI